MGNSATLLCYMWCLVLIILVYLISFNFALSDHQISSSPIHPPLGDLQTHRSYMILNMQHQRPINKCQQIIPKHITIKHTIYQVYKDKDNMSMQDIKTSKRKRESNRKHGRFVSRFEHTCSTSPPSTLEGFSLKIDPTGSLGAATPTRSSHQNSWTLQSLHSFLQELHTAST